MQRRSNMLSIVQRRLAYSEKYCDNINGVEQKQRVFSSWNILINNKPSPLSQAMILVMNHVMEVINNHIKKNIKRFNLVTSNANNTNKLMSI